MLSTLVQRQKLWVLPLLISLAFSWCLMLCQNVAQAATLTPASTAEHSLPPCHSQSATTDTAAVSTGHGDSNCSGCDSQAAHIEPLSLPLLAALVSWQPWLTALPASNAIPLSLLHTPPPKRRLPLYLAINQLRI